MWLLAACWILFSFFMVGLWTRDWKIEAASQCAPDDTDAMLRARDNAGLKSMALSVVVAGTPIALIAWLRHLLN